MDRAALSEESIHELGALFEAALREAVTALSVADLDGLERRLQALGRQVLGQVVERVLALRAAQEGMEREPCAHCGGAMRRVDQARERHIQGVVGDDTLRRAYDLCDACHCGRERALAPPPACRRHRAGHRGAEPEGAQHAGASATVAIRRRGTKGVERGLVP